MVFSNWVEVVFILFMVAIIILGSQVLTTALLALLVLLVLRELLQLRLVLAHLHSVKNRPVLNGAVNQSKFYKASLSVNFTGEVTRTSWIFKDKVSQSSIL